MLAAYTLPPMNPIPAQLPAPISMRFCSPESDLTFRSSDGVLFKVHRQNLDSITGGFPPHGVSPSLEGEVVPLTETAPILELLFQFIYPQRHPELEGLDFGVLAPLAEAVEKYQVYSAMTICKIRMQNALPEHAPEILNYAAKHGYLDVANQAAPFTIGMPLTDIMTILAPNIIIPWITYYGEWLKALQFSAGSYGNSLVQHQGGVLGGDVSCSPWGIPCAPWGAACARITSRLGGDVGSLHMLDRVFQHEGRSCCDTAMTVWRKKVESRVSAIPSFMTFY